jgi:hypothetical protein
MFDIELIRKFDVLFCLIEIITHTQFWNKIVVLKTLKTADFELEYCFIRGSENLWTICEKNKCTECENTNMVTKLKGKLIDFDTAAIKINNNYLYIQKMSQLLDKRILSAVNNKDIASYQEYIIVFQFPKHTLFPEQEKGVTSRTELDSAKELGFGYIKKIIPVFDKVLIKRNFLRHSFKSAISAIIARNHSHHIGSHVTPRTSIDKCQVRLKVLEGKNNQCEKNYDIITSLKSRLDEYIQQKADFTAEIATEPITSTKRNQFFNQILAGFIQNTLLMDNIGANEGVNYLECTSNNGMKTSRNRLKIHFLHNNIETKAFFADSQNQNTVSQIQYPYSGCSSFGEPLILKEPANDYDIALPGPMGEFAFYSFLENLIRNSIKHNIDKIKGSNNSVNIYINIAKFPNIDINYLKCEIWDDLTKPSDSLKKDLNIILKSSLVDNDGRLIKGGWGIAEMKIMATLLSGSTDFLGMADKLKIEPAKKNGKDVLVYEFKVMKPKEVAIISSSISKQKTLHERSGIIWFKSIEEYIKATMESPIHFNFILIDYDNNFTSESIENKVHLFPNRILIHEKLQLNVQGSCTFNDEIMKGFVNFDDADTVLKRMWELWLIKLKNRHGYQNPRLSIFFQQKKDEYQTETWINKFKELDQSKNKIFDASIIYKHGKRNSISPESEIGLEKETHFVFDRHGGGHSLLRKQKCIYHQAFDKNSSDFVPIFSTPEDQIYWQVNHLIEASFLKVLVIDERVAEVAFNSVIRPNPDGSIPKSKEAKIYGSTLKIDVAKYSGVYITTHLNLNNKGPKPVSSKMTGDENSGCCVSMSMSDNDCNISEFNVNWLDDKNSQCGKFDVVIIHQGVLEASFKNYINNGKESSFIENISGFVKSLRNHVPYIVIDSGRGIPANLPDTVKFLPFSLIENYLMKNSIAKLSLTKVLMSLTRRQHI